MSTIAFCWPTGQIEMELENILHVNAAKLKKLVSAATDNAAEVKAQIAGFLHGLLDELNEKNPTHQPRIKEYRSLLDVVEDRKPRKAEKAITRIMNGCANYKFDGAFMDAGKQCFTDGYRLIRLAAPIPFRKCEGVLNTEKSIGNVADYCRKLELPDVKILKKALALARKGVDSGRIHTLRRNQIGYDFGYGLPLVNAAWLLDMLEALPNCAAFCNPGKENSPIYFTAGDDDGMLLPIRKEREYEDAPVTVAVTEPETVKSESEAVMVTATAATEPEQDAPQVKNLSQFKKAMRAGHAFKILRHYIHPEMSGQLRKPNKVQTNAVFTIVPGEPDNPVSLANDGRGCYLEYGKAGNWDFTGNTIKRLNGNGDVIMELTFDLAYAALEEQAAPVVTVAATQSTAPAVAAPAAPGTVEPEAATVTMPEPGRTESALSAPPQEQGQNAPVMETRPESGRGTPRNGETPTPRIGGEAVTVGVTRTTIIVNAAALAMPLSAPAGHGDAPPPSRDAQETPPRRCRDSGIGNTRTRYRPLSAPYSVNTS